MAAIGKAQIPIVNNFVICSQQYINAEITTKFIQRNFNIRGIIPYLRPVARFLVVPSTSFPLHL